MNRRDFVITSMSAALAASLPLFPTLAFSKTTNTYSYLTPFTLSLAFSPILYASAADIYKDLDLDVKVEVGRGAGQVIQLVSADQIDSGRTGGANYMSARSMEGSNMIAFATVSQISPFVIISSESKPVKSVKELEGKTIGMASFGGSMEATLNLMLAKAGIDPKSVQRERVADGPASFAMVEAGRIHCFFGNVSTVSRLHAESLPLVVMDVDDGIPGQVYIARDADLEENPDKHVAFLKGAWTAIHLLAEMNDEQLLEAIRLIGKKYDVPGIEKEDIALSDLKGNIKLWLAKGKDNVLKNVPEEWDAAKELLVRSELMQETNKALYTNAIWEKAIG